MVTQTAKSLAHEARNSKILHGLARVGFAVNGLMHLMIGLIAIEVATGSNGEKADQSGALGQLSESPVGGFILWAIVVGLFALGLWLALGAFLYRGPDRKHRWAHRLAELGKAAAYFLVGGTALTFAQGGQTSSEDSAHEASAKLLASPGGVALLVVVGLAVVGIGGYFIYKGVARKFVEDIDVPDGTVGKATVGLGVAGYVSKGIAIGVVGILLALAAFAADASRANGLDGALKALLQLPFGQAILCVVGAGLIAYGVYCFVRARRAHLY